MNNKCTKYEALFTFGNDETLKSHLETCEDCKKMQQKMDRISELLQEVKPYYISKSQNVVKLKAACAALVILLGSATFGIVNFNSDVSDMIKYGTTLSADDLGLPVDEYGFIMVE